MKEIEAQRTSELPNSLEGGLLGLGEALLRVAKRNTAEVSPAARNVMHALMCAFERAEDRGSVCVRAHVAQQNLLLPENLEEAQESEYRLHVFQTGLADLEKLGLLARLECFLVAAQKEAQREGSGHFTPIVLDDPTGDLSEARIYFARFALEELDLARMLWELAKRPLVRNAGTFSNMPKKPEETAAEDAVLVERITKAVGADTLQRQAVALALRERLAIISGGPGTGKTTTVAQILECLLERTPGLRIALMAPTGKATSRMLESIRASASRGFLPRLRETLQADEFLPEAARLVRGRTIHKWLVSPTATGERPGPGNPLTADVIIVDEASMVDIHLAHRLLGTVCEKTRLIILGDKHQLAAVGPGAVFAELSESHGVLGEHVVELKKSRRFQEGTVIAKLAEAINHQGEVKHLSEKMVFERVLAVFQEGETSALSDYQATLHMKREEEDWATLPESAVRVERERFSRTGLTREAREWLDRELDRYGEKLLDFRRAWEANAPGVILKGFADALWQCLSEFRALAAQRSGKMSVNAINAYATERIRAFWPLNEGHGNRENFPGRVIIVRKNDDRLNLHNGDTAIMLPMFSIEDGVNKIEDIDLGTSIPKSSEMLAEDPESFLTGPTKRWDREGRSLSFGAWLGDEERMLSSALLPIYDTAWAMTIHQSQGSEFERVAVFLPDDALSGLATRELLYTGVTRTKKRVDVFGAVSVLEAAVRRQTMRDGSLGRRLEALEKASHEMALPSVEEP